MFYNILYANFAQNMTILHVFKYVTFRSICAFLTSFFVCLLIGERIINWLRSIQKNGQPIRLDGPSSHIERKKGTPTMGGIMIVFSLCTSTLLWADLTNIKVLVSIFVLIAFAVIGGIDDFFKLKFNSSKGLSGSKKVILQVIITCIAYYSVLFFQDTSESTKIMFPIFKNIGVDLGCFFIIWVILVVVGSSNAVNLTDGLDGLAVGPVFVSSVCLAIISYLVGNYVFSDYLHIHYIPGTAELCVFLSALVGASFGFLWFNAPPAKVFMGDTGSISIGGTLGFIAILTKHEVVFSIVGGIFVLEALSVMIQVMYFKLTGKRVFLMAPIHHHFEKKGWAESTVVFRFWIISIILGILGLATIKLR